MTRVSHVLMLGDDMRLGSLTVSATLSAVLLSGCSFIGGPAAPFKNPFAKQKAAQHAQYGARNQAHAGNRCQVFSRAQPIPQGCRPEQVTLGVANQGGNGAYGGFPQQPQFGNPGEARAQYTDGAYGSAVGQTAALAHHTSAPKKRKPKLRGSLSLGLERSVSGDLIDYDKFSVDAVGAYNPQLYIEGRQSGLDRTGDRVETTYTANVLPGNLPNYTDAASYFVPGAYEEISSPSISFDDAWAAPTRVAGGLEYIGNGKTTFFANAGYTHSKGNDGTSATVKGTVYAVNEVGVYDYIPAVEGQAFIPGINGGPDTPPVAARAEEFIRVDTDVAASFVPNQQIAQFDFDFSELRRFDLEAGARHYFKPVVKSEGYRTVTPFIGASAGAAHYNAVSVKVSQRQRFYERALTLNGGAITENTPGQYYDITGPATTVEIFDDQWVPSGQLNVGAEWQVTPGTALALESGVKVQGGRKYTNGSRADTDISVPVTLRGSFNF